MKLVIIKLIYWLIGALLIYVAALAAFLYKRLDIIMKEPFNSLLASDIRRKIGM